MKKKAVVGIDISKLTIDCHIDGTSIYHQFKNNLKGFKDLLKWINKHIEHPIKDVLICFEITGLYSLSLAQFLAEKKIEFVMENPMQIKRSMDLVRGKNDQIDEKRIAGYTTSQMRFLKTTSLPSRSLKKLENLIILRDKMVRQRGGYKASLGEFKRVLNQRYEMGFWIWKKSMIKGFDKQILKIEKSIMELIKFNEDLDKNYKLIISIKGIGKVIAVNILVSTCCFTRFSDSRKYACYCGTALFPNRSGTSLKGNTKVSHFANKKMKTLLYMAATKAIQHDPELKAYYNKRLAIGKNKMSTINIIKNKIIHRIFAVVKREASYVELYQHTT